MEKKITEPLFARPIAADFDDADFIGLGGHWPTDWDVLPDSGEGRQYIDALAEAVQESDRIVVTEHSNVDDVVDPVIQAARPVGYVPIIYVTHELTAVERADFLDQVRAMAERTQDAEPACIFDPHHTITFYRGTEQASVMRICFQCGQVRWNGSAKMRPWSLIPTLVTLIVSVGMKAERDWRQLAKAAAT